MGTVDRKNALLAQDVVTGIDFVAVDGSQPCWTCSSCAIQ